MQDKHAQESGNDATGTPAEEGEGTMRHKDSNGIQETVNSGSNDNGNGHDEQNTKKGTGGATTGGGNKGTKQEGDIESKSQNGVVENETEKEPVDSQSESGNTSQSEPLFDEEVINILKEDQETEEQEQPLDKVKSTWQIECEQIRYEEKPVAALAKTRDSLKAVIADLEGPQKAEEFTAEFDASDYGSAMKAHKMHMIGLVRRLKTTWNQDTLIVDKLEPEVASAEKIKEELEKEMLLKDKRIEELNELVGVGVSAQTESDRWITEMLQDQLDTASRENQLLSDEITRAREHPDWQEETLEAMQDRLDEVENLFNQKKQKKKKIVEPKMVKVLRMYSTATETIGGVSRKRRKTENSDDEQDLDNDADDNATDESRDSIKGASSVQDDNSDVEDESSDESENENSDDNEETDDELDNDSSEESDEEVETSEESDTDSSEESSRQSERETTSATPSSDSRETLPSAGSR
ncbi:uncharacterized protein DDB_G0283697-like [Branchiostoma lanceolatum]|uniref:uncharacterized protein DDB_G0283697-like n=1 Tax=Branchiostoma lanceolatum TaxID=7740 RepID=UPI0034525F22